MSTQTDICLGCGNPYIGAFCPECEIAAGVLIQSSHWPLETSLSPAALSAVETGVRIMLERAPWGDTEAERAVQGELHNLASNIRSHLQHVQAANWEKVRVARKAAGAPQEKDPLLL